MLLEPPTRRLSDPPAAPLDRGLVRALVSKLDHPAGWPEAAAALVGNLGFLLIEANLGGAPAAAEGSLESHLIVALRERPTVRHFDPEEIAFYRPSVAGADLHTVRRLPAGATARYPVSWGHVHVVDRIPVENRFLSFGGDLRLAAVGPALTVAHLRSPAPIARWGGHSQGTDGLAEAMGAFFGRLIIPVDFVPGAAARIDSLAPEVIFTAFVIDATRRLDSPAMRGFEPSDLDRWLRAVGLHLAVAWRAAAEDLLATIG
ncbi:MAG TPA: hypothetical protein VE011_04350 [Candidatus Dormibacteraeota bacterium]|nr:hypothetical protein [Candidatus Dormibacteraeota bacterium]